VKLTPESTEKAGATETFDPSVTAVIFFTFPFSNTTARPTSAEVKVIPDAARVPVDSAVVEPVRLGLTAGPTLTKFAVL
jgi:hypothetical protein